MQRAVRSLHMTLKNTIIFYHTYITGIQEPEGSLELYTPLLFVCPFLETPL